VGTVDDRPAAGNPHLRRHLARHLGPLLPVRFRRIRRPILWQEIAFILVSYWVYSLIRDSVPTHDKPALEHASSVLKLERRLHINIEHPVNRFFDAVHWGGWHYLANIANYYYAVMHFVIVIGVLVWLYVKRPLFYRSARTVLYATNAVAAFGFWLYPLAPPRVLTGQGFIDTLVKYHTWGSLASGGVSKISNQYAAMPSLHIGWSLWAGLCVFALAKPWWVRIIALSYPVATFLVIIGTANHYVLDAVGGVIALSLGFLIQHLLTGHGAYALPDAEAPAAEEHTHLAV
jgi:hypothetical protein